MNNFKLIKPYLIEQSDWEYFTTKAPSWYETPGHSILYAHEPPEWIAIWYNTRSEPTDFCCFSVTGKLIHLKGPSTATGVMLKELLQYFKGYALSNPYQKLKSSKKQSCLRERFYKSDSDWIIQLPNTFEEYLNNLGKTTQKHLKKYIKRLDKDMVSEFAVYEKDKITNELITEFFDLHRLRMEKSGKEFLLTDEKTKRRIKLAQQKGMFCGRWVDGKLIGGTLNIRHGSTYYLSTVAHHPDYDKYHSGLLAIIDTVRYFISINVENYNLHVRYSPFKTRLGGKENNHYNQIIFANIYGAIWWYLQQLRLKLKKK